MRAAVVGVHDEGAHRPLVGLDLALGLEHGSDRTQPVFLDPTPKDRLSTVAGMTGQQRAEEEVRAEVRAWLDANWDADRHLVEWRRLLADAGWAVPSWPKRWHGRELPAWADKLVADELRRAGAVGTPLGAGMSLAAPTIMTHGSDELRTRILRPTITGEVTWTQLFSEPGAGSDLAGLTTTARRDGDDFVVNGQKVWNTSAHHADFGMLLARTDWEVPKHQGISYFVLPMDQPGVVVRPILQMNRHSSFNEVFLTDARIPAANLVGALGDGWRVARDDPDARADVRDAPAAVVRRGREGTDDRGGRRRSRRSLRHLRVVPAAGGSGRPRHRTGSPLRAHRRSDRPSGDRRTLVVPTSARVDR